MGSKTRDVRGTTGATSKTLDGVDNRVCELEVELLADPAIDECVVLDRDNAGGVSERLAYVVISPSEDPTPVVRYLEQAYAQRIASFIPVFRIPLCDDGSLDRAQLAALPVQHGDTDAHWGAQIAAMPEISRAAAVTGRWPEPARHLHRSDLIEPRPPIPVTANRSGDLSDLATTARHTGDRASADRPPAIYHGGAEPRCDGDANVLPRALLAAPADATIVYISSDGRQTRDSYGGLIADARRILRGLRDMGVSAGDRVILQLTDNRDILAALWGCVLGGIAPVIGPLPVSYEQPSRALSQLGHVHALFERPVIVTDQTRLRDLRAAPDTAPLGSVRAAAIEELRGHAPDPDVHIGAPDDVAFYTLSSGSTGVPKAVPLTHRNLLSRARGVNAACAMSARDVILNWLPFDHIGSISDWHVRCILLGCALIYVPKEYVLGRPLRWLDLMHEHRVTHSWAPNFAYSLVSDAVERERGADRDLSRVQMLLTAGESITTATVDRFLRSLAPCGLQPSAVQSAFGMAEVGSGVTYHQPATGSSLSFRHVDRNSLGEAIHYVAADDPARVSFASLGPIIPGMSMRIVDADRNVLPEHTTGRLHLRGDALSPGYYRNDKANQAFLDDGWFDTGDMGFIADGALFLTGRAEAGIIINGANFYNSEIEAVVDEIDGVVASFTAACAVRPPGHDSDQLAVFFHTTGATDPLVHKLINAIQARLTKRLGIKADYLLPVARAAIPKTAIGKLQRKKLTRQFHDGEFDALIRRIDVLTGNENTLPDWFYRRAWRRKHIINALDPRGDVLIVSGPSGTRSHALARDVATALGPRDIRCVTATAGDGFARVEPDALALRLDEPADWRALVEWLDAENVRVSSVIYVASYDRPDGDEVDRTRTLARDRTRTLARDRTRTLARDAIRVLAFVQAVQAHAATTPQALRLLAVGARAHAVVDGDDVALSAIGLSRFIQAMARQVPWLRCAFIDAEGAPDRDAAAIVAELCSSSPDVDIAYRDGARWIAGVQKIAAASAPKHPLPFRTGGTYVVHGAHDGVGSELVDRLQSQFDARVILVDSRSPGDAIDAQLTAVGDAAIDGCVHIAAAPARSIWDETPDALRQTVDRELGAVWSLYQLAATTEGAAFITIGALDSDNGAVALGAAVLDGLQHRRARSSRACGIELPIAGDAAVSGRRAIDSIFAGLALGGRVLAGVDGDDPAVRAQVFDRCPAIEVTKAFVVSAGDGVTAETLGTIALTDRFGTPARCDYVELREPDQAAPEQFELWPSVAEYFVYDELIYYALANDERRNQSYRVALYETVRDKVVLDLGTGKEAILARLALEAGARKVYAIEKGDEAFAQATEFLRQRGLDDRITVLHGDSTTVELPELVDVCVSEIVGPIGGCEGAAVLINDAQRFLRPGGLMIPGRSVTKIAAARFPDGLPGLGFYQVPGSYTERIFEQIGFPFDLRLCVKNFPRDNVLSTAGVFEDLDFNRPIQPEHSHDIDLVVEQDGRCDGFLVWLNLDTIAGETIDILAHEYSWLPVYMPVFEPGIALTCGDRITATIDRTLCDNQLNPDYVITGQVARADGDRIPFKHESYHHRPRYQQHPFYQRLFADDPMGRNPGGRPGTAVRHLGEMPLTAAGAPNLDRLRELARAGDRQAESGKAPASEVEREIADVWREVLDIDEVGVNDNFFELGGHSLLLVQAHDRLAALFGAQVTLVDLFNYPTIADLAAFLSDSDNRTSAAERGQARAEKRAAQTHGSGAGDDERGFAVIGMACRFPGADDVDEFWRNLIDGRESVMSLTEQQVLAEGIDAASAQHPGYVLATPTLSDVTAFDAAFFGYSDREADLMDPQHRLFLECAWETMEIAGYDPLTYAGAVGVYAGASMNTYLLNNVMPNRGALDANDDLWVTTLDSMGGFQLMVASDKDYLPTRVSYKLNLTGPSINVQTACSTGLVAIHLGCQSLATGESDMVLAGGASVQVPQLAGHMYQDGMIVSPDGHCRAYDAQARGTVFGSGIGAVLLKRLGDAVRDRDHIFAVIKGSAVNNDGGVKVGYMAPSGDGQAAVVTEALAMADISPDTVSFVEGHGTGTEMGDPIEIAGLTEAFRTGSDRTGYCAVGSVKTNVGHLQIASGSVGFIKTALAVERAVIPPSLHFEAPNPAIDFASSPFYVNTEPRDWPADRPRRAGVNSLGIGGTNAHVVLEQAPPLPDRSGVGARSTHVLSLAARSDQALADLVARYRAFVADDQARDMAVSDMCFTSNVGRAHFDHRAGFAASSLDDLTTQLAEWAPQATDSVGNPGLVFLFTGQGAQYPAMGKVLFDTQPVFRDTLEQCHELLRDRLRPGLLDVMYPTSAAPSGESLLDRTAYTQPALFALEYALYRMWSSWGVEPSAVLGHSVGEYVAACVAGVFSFEDGLALVAERGRLMDAQPTGGAMAAVFAPEADVVSRIEAYGDQVSIAAVNGPTNTVISGEQSAIRAILETLQADDIRFRELRVSHAFHSPMMDGAVAALERYAARVEFSPPRIPLIGNHSGALLTAEHDDITRISYWGRQLRQPVRFADCIATAVQAGYRQFVELGPRPTLVGMARHCVDDDSAHTWLPTLRHGDDDWRVICASVAQLYQAGQAIDWAAFHGGGADHRRVVLPTYPFQRRRHWLDRPVGQSRAATRRAAGSAHAGLLEPVPLSPLIPHVLFEGQLSVATAPLLADHRVFDRVVVSGACHVSMVIRAAMAHLGTTTCELDDVLFTQALVIPDDGAARVQLVLDPLEDDRYSFKLISVSDDASHISHVEGAVRAAGSDSDSRASVARLAELTQRCAQPLPAAEFYDSQARRRIALGDSYRWLTNIYRGADESLGQIAVPSSVELEPQGLHPGLIDACFGLLLTCGDLTDSQTLIPFKVDRVHAAAAPPDTGLWAHARLTASTDDGVTGDVAIFDDAGTVIFQVLGLQGRRVARDAFAMLAGSLARDLVYQVDWQPAEAIGNGDSRQVAAGSWLVLGGNDPMSLAVAQRIRELGRRCHIIAAQAHNGVEATSGDDPLDQATALRANEQTTALRVIDPLDPNAFDELLKTLDEPVAGIIHLWTADPIDPAELTGDRLNAMQARGCGALLHLVQAVRDAGWPSAPELWIVTRGSQPVGDGPIHIEQSPVWSLGRVISMEHPELACVRVDLDPGDADEQSHRLVQEIAHRGTENEIAWRGQRRFISRLISRTEATDRELAQPVDIDPDATYLITGGLGALGLHVAGWLCDRGARHLVLASRRGSDDAAAGQLQRLRDHGCEVEIVATDVSQPGQVADLLGHIASGSRPLKGVLHLAGRLDDGVLTKQTWARFQDVMAAKVAGTFNLHHQTRELPLDLFVCFSSIASVLGPPAQGNYAAANGFQDAICHLRRSIGKPALSINWGPWAGSGMAAEISQRDQQRIAEQGLRALDPDVALSVMGDLLANGAAQRVVLSIDWAAFQRASGSQALAPLLQAVTPRVAPSVRRPWMREQLEAAPRSTRRNALRRLVRAEITKIIGRGSTTEFSDRDGLFDLGLDSLMAIDLKNRLSVGLGAPLPSTLVFDFPTVQAIAEHLETAVPELALGREQPQPDPTGDQADAADDELDDMSESELLGLLADELDSSAAPGVTPHE